MTQNNHKPLGPGRPEFRSPASGKRKKKKGVAVFVALGFRTGERVEGRQGCGAHRPLI